MISYFDVVKKDALLQMLHKLNYCKFLAVVVNNIMRVVTKEHIATHTNLSLALLGL